MSAPVKLTYDSDHAVGEFRQYPQLLASIDRSIAETEISPNSVPTKPSLKRSRSQSPVLSQAEEEDYQEIITNPQYSETPNPTTTSPAPNPPSPSFPASTSATATQLSSVPTLTLPPSGTSELPESPRLASDHEDQSEHSEEHISDSEEEEEKEEEVETEGEEMYPLEERKHWEDQNFYYNNLSVYESASGLFMWARELLDGVRGSPSSKNKVTQVHEAMSAMKTRESDGPTLLKSALFHVTRMVRKSHAPTTDAVPSPEQYELRSFEDDHFAAVTRVNFLPQKGHLPQLKAEPGSIVEKFNADAKVTGCVPDLCCAYDLDTFSQDGRVIFEHAGMAIAKGLYLPFLCAELKTEDEAPAAAENQCMKDGAAMVWSRAKWSAQAEGKPRQEVEKYQATNGKGEGTSTIDHSSAAFAISVAKNAACTHICFRQIWENGAVYWHCVPLKVYRLEPPFGELTEDFARHIANIVDWGLGDRADTIFEQGTKIAGKTTKRKHEAAELFKVVKRAKVA